MRMAARWPRPNPAVWQMAGSRPRPDAIAPRKWLAPDRSDLARHGGLQHLAEPVHLERLLQGRPVPVGFREAVLAIAGGKDEGLAAGGQGIGHRLDALTVEIDVENGKIEIGVVG